MMGVVTFSVKRSNSTRRERTWINTVYEQSWGLILTEIIQKYVQLCIEMTVFQIKIWNWHITKKGLLGQPVFGKQYVLKKVKS